MTTHSIAVLLLLLGGLTWAGLRFYRTLRPLTLARPTGLWTDPGTRLLGVLTNVGLHRRLLKLRFAGILHATIFVSFLILLTAVVEGFGSGLIPGFSLAPIGGDTWIALLQELVALALMSAIALAAYQRYAMRPARFAGSNRRDAGLIYLLVLAVVVTMLGEFASAIATGTEPSAPWRPVSGALASAMRGAGLTPTQAHVAETAFYWLHLVAILGFLVYIPGSKHRHMFTAVPNIFFRNTGPKGVLPAPIEAAPDAPEGRGLPAKFDWKQMLDLYSCTECGRCQDVCPAHAAGMPLSPKRLIMDLRDALGDPESDAVDVVAPETLWACTTCRACMEACPLHIEHVPKIVELRRDMVERGAIEPMLQDALSNIQQYGNSFGKPPRTRAKWTRELDFKIKDARKEPVDVLWFVGDFASFDTRVQRNTRRVAELLHTAGLDFGILYDAEQNSGNDVRRAGEEGLFDMLARHNVETLAGVEFNRIMTTDPHSLNALRQEYRLYGADYDVVHYSQVLAELLADGRLTPAENSGTGRCVTYHDPCYLGRYNDEFDAPRRIIAALGHRLHEMGRCRENSFCCGAGGGRIWMDDSGASERPSENRIKEALALGDVDTFVVACPKDVVMYSAAVQALGVEDRMAVRDLVDLVRPAM
jgi:Fe-S oxidoreductase